MSARFTRTSSEEYRPLTISYDGLARADGSARFGFGDCVALASLSGPIEVRLTAEQPSQATFEVLVRPLANVPATDAKAQAATIRAALTPSLVLTKNPRTLVQLVVQNLSASAGAAADGQIAAMVNASTLALLNAGSVPMTGAVCAVSVGRTAEGTYLVDPHGEEAERLVEGGCFAFMFAGGQRATCVWTNWRARGRAGFKQEHMEEARRLAEDGARAVYGEVRRSLGAQHGEDEDDVEE